ncbi:transcription repressor NadR [Lederbergia wuyishanensis]|uniref:Transcriptional regulator of NAD metabolism n=1 Tax=Lederbergia wuyishanensis TaxID=1347903 RepID=A0ABU0D1U0_9BACI|nr:transcription repressor NadR [Lederbergia wuyishanensis]MCJ8006958.1 transcription repressor NadR [Lederbergia wuyishanensis]MDQ0342342.1 transcriptional regulator of NAD metabolism [Lederbergia wuyishanensis]
MEESKKLNGDERREMLLSLLKESVTPITGSRLAQIANVSRQVIVGDITLLKAKEEPIIATSQGYLYMNLNPVTKTFEKTIACLHTREQTEEELNIIVDHGVTVKDVKVEHPVYGDLTASIMVSNRQEVQTFLSKIRETNANLLADLTLGIHLHTLSSSSEEAIKKAEKALKDAGILMN